MDRLSDKWDRPLMASRALGDSRMWTPWFHSLVQLEASGVPVDDVCGAWRAGGGERSEQAGR